MRTTLTTVVALASTFQVASAGWTDASAFSCPSNTNNHCSSDQSSGFDWSSLSLGSFSSYAGFSFDGFSCASSFGGSSKRDVLTGRNFQDKCITGEASSDVSSCPSFSCGSDSEVSAFSVDEFQVSVEFDCDLEFHYGMSDGSTCKQTSSCSQSGTTVKNTQCGGAKNVSIVYPSQSSGGGKSSCSIGVHSIGFDCSSASSTVHPSTTQVSYTKPTSAPTTPASSAATTTPVSSPAESTPATSTPVESSPTSSSSQGVETTPSSTPATSTPVESSPVTTPASVQLTTSTVFTTSVSTVISCGPEVISCPARSTVLTTVVIPVSTTICPVTATETTPASTPESSASSSGVESTPTPSSSVEIPSSTTVIISTPSITSPESSAAATSSSGSETTPSVSEVITTEIVYTSTTLCPVTATQTSNGVTSTSVGVSTSTILITTTSTICTKCEHSATESTLASSTPAGVVTSSTTASAPASTAPCPNVLPQCLNTWLYTTGCSSNTDSDCYCPSSSFVSSVYECLSAHGASDEISAAQSYFQGICAAHVSSNPAIVTAASTVTVTASSGGVVATSIPVTTVQILTTLTVPCTESTGISSGSVIPGSSTTSVLSTAITVPQVQFTTVAGATTAAAALVPATTVASQAAGVTTGVPAATTFSSVGISNATVTSKPSSTSAVPFTGAGSRNGMAIGSIGAAVLFAVFAM